MHPLTESAMKPIKLAAQTEVQGTRFSDAFGHIMSGLMRWHRRRRDEALLQAQPDYMLRDIGLGRSEIEAAVRGEARWRR
jgi:uncharacterized protein YjiS (DUF1127 family)